MFSFNAGLADWEDYAVYRGNVLPVFMYFPL